MNGKLSEEKTGSFLLNSKTRKLVKKAIVIVEKIIINNGWQETFIHYEKKKESPMNQQEIFT